MKRIKYIIITLSIICVTTPMYFHPQTEEVSIKIPKGINLKSISEILYENRIIQDIAGFKILVKINKKSSSLSYGWYRFNKLQNPLTVMNIMTEGRRITICITIPEGLNYSQILKIFKENSDIDVEKMDSLYNDIEFIKSTGIGVNSLEGYLMPDTYIFYLSEEPELVIKKMVSNLFSIMKPDFRKEIKGMKFTVHEILTVASLIEKEAMIDREKPIISSVIYNRLKNGMRLQIDATILYALGKHKKRVYLKDLKINSPYNTYKHSGLPPGPIANPGLLSILAAIHPAETDYLYYVATGKGDHIFTENHSAHIEAKRKAKKNW